MPALYTYVNLVTGQQVDVTADVKPGYDGDPHWKRVWHAVPFTMDGNWTNK